MNLALFPKQLMFQGNKYLQLNQKFRTDHKLLIQTEQLQTDLRHLESLTKEP
jgi:hypothetical protein